MENARVRCLFIYIYPQVIDYCLVKRLHYAIYSDYAFSLLYFQEVKTFKNREMNASIYIITLIKHNYFKQI